MVFTDNRGYLRRMMADLLILLKANSLPSIDAKNLGFGFKMVLMKKNIVIGVAGGTGSGKTTVVGAIADKMNDYDILIIQHDSYYKDQSYLPLSERERINYDHPDALETSLLLQNLKDLAAGNQVEVPEYDFASHARKKFGKLLLPAKVIILEGILVLADHQLRQLMDIKIFVDTDDDIRFIRRLQRDTIERQRSIGAVIRQYMESVKPMHIDFAGPSKKYADIILPGANNNVAVDMVVLWLEMKLTGQRVYK